jgi:hypothetical protein
MSETQEAQYYSTGRGGAGNMLKATSGPEPREINPGEATPHLKQQVYTTGRGGLGNMRSNRDEKETRQAQDVDEQSRFSNSPEPTSSNTSIGRGGYGNVKATRREASKLLEKAKNLFR